MDLKKILLIDDSEADQFLAKTFIEEFDPDIEILQAYDGAEALKAIEQIKIPPDVIFLDINMPVMDGHEFLSQYSKRADKISVVIMLTSSEQKKDKEAVRKYEFVKKYIIKPLTLETLEEVKKLIKNIT